ncbi:hypothetical protein KIPB_015725, partial [Kipferlia bialata]|eukprot:g15725.t1
MLRTLCLLCIVAAVWCTYNVGLPVPDAWDWGDVDGQDYLTSVRNQ